MTPNVRHRVRRENISATKELKLWIWNSLIPSAPLLGIMTHTVANYANVTKNYWHQYHSYGTGTVVMAKLTKN